jgi:hypothetical protein
VRERLSGLQKGRKDDKEKRKEDQPRGKGRRERIKAGIVYDRHSTR